MHKCSKTLLMIFVGYVSGRILFSHPHNPSPWLPFLFHLGSCDCHEILRPRFETTKRPWSLWHVAPELAKVGKNWQFSIWCHDSEMLFEQDSWDSVSLFCFHSLCMAVTVGLFPGTLFSRCCHTLLRMQTTLTYSPSTALQQCSVIEGIRCILQHQPVHCQRSHQCHDHQAQLCNSVRLDSLMAMHDLTYLLCAAGVTKYSMAVLKIVTRGILCCNVPIASQNSTSASVRVDTVLTRSLVEYSKPQEGCRQWHCRNALKDDPKWLCKKYDLQIPRKRRARTAGLLDPRTTADCSDHPLAPPCCLAGCLACSHAGATQVA